MNPTATIKCQFKGKDGSEEISRTINLTETADYQQDVVDSIHSEISLKATSDISIWGILEYTQAEWICERNIFTALCEADREIWRDELRVIPKWFAFELKLLEMLQASTQFGYHEYPPQSHPFRNEPSDWGSN